MDHTSVVIDSNQETPDLIFSEETPDIDFGAEINEIEVPQQPRYTTEETDIDDLDEPDQYVEKSDDGDVDDDNDEEDQNQKAGAHKADSKIHHDNRFLQLPLARVKLIMKVDPDVTLITGECAFLVAKATELFIESLARESFLHTAQAKKKTVQKRDVDAAIENVDALMFLDGMMNL